MNSQLINFLSEFLNRLFLKSPKFFVIWQNIGLVLTFISGIPELLGRIDANFGTNIMASLPDVVEKFANKTIFVAGVVMFLMSKIAVKPANPTPVTPSGEKYSQKPNAEVLPFTTTAQIKQDIKQAEKDS